MSDVNADLTGVFSPLREWQPTCVLRFVERLEVVEERHDGATLGRTVRVLQQQWAELMEGNFTGEQEWRDVPLVEGV